MFYFTCDLFFSGNALISVIVVALRRTRLLLGWVTVPIPFRYITNHHVNSAIHPCGIGKSSSSLPLLRLHGARWPVWVAAVLELPLSSLDRAPSSAKFLTPPPRRSPQPPGSLQSLTRNGLLLLLSHVHRQSPNHACYMISTAFGYKQKFLISRLTVYKNAPFEIKNLKIWRKGALPPPTVESRRAPSRHHIAHACLDLTAYIRRLIPLAVFEQFEHWVAGL